MIKKIIILFKILRKFSVSGAVKVIDDIKPIPKVFKVLFYIFSLGNKNTLTVSNITSGDKLCNALQGMGTTFIKLGQFLATRPDIIGNEIATKLEKLQDKLPAFDTREAQEIVKKEIGKKLYDSLISFGNPVAAASIAQVHFAKIKIDQGEKEVAIKVLRPNIHKIVNEELDALMFLAFIIENIFKKSKRLKLIEVIFLLKEITNVEMDLRFEAAAASELYENTLNDKYIKVPKIYWNYTSKQVLALDKINAIPIRDLDSLKKANIDLKQLSKNLIQLFKTSSKRWFFPR